MNNRFWGIVWLTGGGWRGHSKVGVWVNPPKHYHPCHSWNMPPCLSNTACGWGMKSKFSWGRSKPMQYCHYLYCHHGTTVSHGRLKHNTKVWDRDETLRAKLPWHCSPRRRQRHGFMDVKSSPASSLSCKPGCCLLYIGGIYEMFELYLIAWVGKCWGKLL